MARKLNMWVDGFPALVPGDHLLYGGTGVVNGGIQLRTWSDVSHIEIYAGDNKAIASRNGLGVDLYLFRAEGLRYVRRPRVLTPEQFAAGMAWFHREARGLPYNWGDLLRFYLINVDTKGLICSQFAAEFDRQCGVPVFDLQYPEGSECPRDFLLPRELATIWAYNQAQLTNQQNTK